MRARWPVVGERVSGGLYCVETGQGEWQECQSGKDQAGDRSSGAAGFEGGNEADAVSFRDRPV